MESDYDISFDHHQSNPNCTEWTVNQQEVDIEMDITFTDIQNTFTIPASGRSILAHKFTVSTVDKFNDQLCTTISEPSWSDGIHNFHWVDHDSKIIFVSTACDQTAYDECTESVKRLRLSGACPTSESLVCIASQRYSDQVSQLDFQGSRTFSIFQADATSVPCNKTQFYNYMAANAPYIGTALTTCPYSYKLIGSKVTNITSATEWTTTATARFTYANPLVFCTTDSTSNTLITSYPCTYPEINITCNEANLPINKPCTTQNCFIRQLKAQAALEINDVSRRRSSHCTSISAGPSDDTKSCSADNHDVDCYMGSATTTCASVSLQEVAAPSTTTGSSSDSDNEETWMIIGIVFISLSVIMGVIIIAKNANEWDDSTPQFAPLLSNKVGF